MSFRPFPAPSGGNTVESQHPADLQTVFLRLIHASNFNSTVKSTDSIGIIISRGIALVTADVKDILRKLRIRLTQTYR